MASIRRAHSHRNHASDRFIIVILMYQMPNGTTCAMNSKAGILYKSRHGLLGEKWSEKWVSIDATRLLYTAITSSAGQNFPKIAKLGLTTSTSPTSRFFSFTAPSYPSSTPKCQELLLEKYTLECRHQIVSPIQRRTKQPHRFVFNLVPKDHVCT